MQPLRAVLEVDEVHVTENQSRGWNWSWDGTHKSTEQQGSSLVGSHWRLK
jgi:hypothetical protein